MKRFIPSILDVFRYFSVCSFIGILFASCASVVDDGSLRGEASVREIRAYLTQLGTLPPEQTIPEVVTLKSRENEPAQWLSDPDLTGGDADYYMLSRREMHKLSKTSLDNIPPTGVAGIIWPGALLQGRSVREGQPILIPIYDQRKPGRISLNVVSGDSVCFYRDVPTFSASNVTQAMNDILAPYTSGLPANTSFSYQSVHTKEEMAYFLDMTPEAFDATTKGAFDAVSWEKETSKVMVLLRQVFFTMVYDQPNIRDVFTSDMTPEELGRYSGEGNPIAYVSSVSYGRYFVLLYESESVSEDILSRSVSNIYEASQDQSVSVTAQDRRVVKKARVFLRQIGGDPEAGLETITGDPDKIREFIVGGARFSRDNVGEVMDYQVHHLCDNSILPVYRSLDVTYKVTEYIKARKENDVLLMIKNIRCMPLRQTGGNGHISTKSHFTLNPLILKVYDEKNQLVKTFPEFNPELTKIRTAGVKTERFFNHSFDVGVLGEDTGHYIVLEGSVYFYNRRTWSSNDYNAKSKWDSRTYPLRAEFRFNKITKRWEVRYGSATTPGLFGDMALSGNLCSCALEFHVGFSFYANYEIY